VIHNDSKIYFITLIVSPRSSLPC